MAYRLEGTYFENCSCDVLCPCGASNLVLPADKERCRFIMFFHIDAGEVEGTDVGGLSVAMLGDSPAQMTDGGWRVGVFMDEQATEEQAGKLGAVFSGAMGGPPAMFEALLGELLGMETAPIQYADDGFVHRARIGDMVDVEIEDFASAVEGEPMRLVGVGHPASSNLTIARTRRARIKAFGLDLSQDGMNGHASAFSWAA